MLRSPCEDHCKLFLDHDYSVHKVEQQNRRTIISGQARSPARVAGVAKFSKRNHVVQDLRAYSMLHVMTTKWMMCVQEKIELTGMSQRLRLSSTKISGDLLLIAKIKQ